MDDQGRESALASIVPLAMFASAAGALVSMFIIGQHQRSVLLIAMFTAWVLTPYVAFVLVNERARKWNPAARHTVQYSTLLISLLALARYVSVVLRPLKAQPASTFLIVPFISLLLFALLAALAARSARRGSS